ncbi:hypothetical protein AKI39_16695 [Bordetella sp. H567]|uniref:Bug family tripartite tricarboxylate transporter substrate binding protein n=1 Tax=Bordetella sp. H567 TaxID=1697043 RepID=UPI00081CCC7D|nr:tripartite tricarboxylate transporter substrate-binding protein [Bordetella sp. H567]AOB31993.1 hypothetical protein AKI39_16695 [Bordetella sp. H567]
METAINLGKRKLAAATVLSSLLPSCGRTQGSRSQYPLHPSSLVVGYPHGGGADTLARLLADHLGRQLGHKIVVDNKPGAASNIAAESVARAAADGYTLYIGTRANAIHRAMYSHFDFDMARDFAPIGLLAKLPNVMVTSAQAPIATMSDVIALAKTHPGMVTYASTGVASDTHLLGELFQRETHTSLLHVPYRGGAAAMVDLIGGRVDLLIFSLAGALPYLRAGSIRAVAVMSQQRAPAIPDVPTVEESGVLGVDIDTWFGLMAPAGTPVEIVATLNECTNNILINREVQEAFMVQGYVAPLRPNTPETLGQLIAEETERWTAIVRERNITPR